MTKTISYKHKDHHPAFGTVGGSWAGAFPAFPIKDSQRFKREIMLCCSFRNQLEPKKAKMWQCVNSELKCSCVVELKSLLGTLVDSKAHSNSVQIVRTKQ